MLHFSDPGLILWDVVEEHLDEAAFLFEAWERAITSPKFNLIELGKIERRLEAHVDGLLVGGPEVNKRLLNDQLVNAEEPAYATTAALTLLYSRQKTIAEGVLDSALGSEEPLQHALARALELADIEELDRMLLARYRETRFGVDKWLLLDLLTRRGVDAADPGDGWLAGNEDRLIGAALDAAGRFRRRDLIGFVEEHLQADDPFCPRALRASLVLSSAKGWRSCLEWAQSGNAEALRLIALLGRAGDHAVLYEQMKDPPRRELVLSLLGFCGTSDAGDVCVEYVSGKNERLAKAAAESLAWIGGFDLQDAQFRGSLVEPSEEDTLPPLETDDLGADLTLDAIDDLPVPNARAIEAWWKQHRDGFSPETRYVLGRPLNGSALLAALKTGSMWRRRGVALEMAIRSGGAHHISIDAFSRRQLRQMAAIAQQLQLSDITI